MHGNFISLSGRYRGRFREPVGFMPMALEGCGGLRATKAASRWGYRLQAIGEAGTSILQTGRPGGAGTAICLI
ncbi:hypothetical protein AB9P05_22015 [Roseivirga sp. BDSF3-8]|uniref:hypothetical protein n=1 Tax=Roseivirga sp. BDSF3-8 TaxID=3241598 RepID=UPI0035321A26